LVGDIQVMTIKMFLWVKVTPKYYMGYFKGVPIFLVVVIQDIIYKMFPDGIFLADLHKSISKATFLVFLTAAARAGIISPDIMHHL
jgi:3-hydroxymyristoyl/3-hydroxydecanoyl-(acyl carrier protein) dehydratase